MLINPFVAGIFTTIFTEMAIVILYAILMSITKGGKK